jgi:hypothetical protein
VIGKKYHILGGIWNERLELSVQAR